MTLKDDNQQKRTATSRKVSLTTFGNRNPLCHSSIATAFARLRSTTYLHTRPQLRAMASTTPTPTAFFDFAGLRPELRLMVFEELENIDLCNMRLISRQLFGETNEEFGKRFLNKIKILGKVSKVKQIHDILRHPFMAQSKLRIRELRVLPYSS